MQNGNFTVRLLKCWFEYNSNLNSLEAEKQKTRLFNQNGECFQLRTFTQHGQQKKYKSTASRLAGLSTREAFQKHCDEIDFFIMADVTNLPDVRFQIHSSGYILKHFPTGYIGNKKINTIFTFSDDPTSFLLP